MRHVCVERLAKEVKGMSTWKSLATTLWLAFICSAHSLTVLGQASAGTMTGCLLRSGSPGFYMLQEQGTGLTTTVAGSDDLQKNDLEKYSIGSRVKLTGKLVREEGRDVFRVTQVEQLSA